MRTVQTALTNVGLSEYWDEPTKAASEMACDWKGRVYRAVEAASDVNRVARMEGMPSVQVYNRIKYWGANTKDYSFSRGEEGRPGRLVPERYLDDRSRLKGTRLKLLCRLNCLPVMDRVGREVKPKWPKASRVCFACGCGSVEDTRHFIMDCAGLLAQLGRILSRASCGMTAAEFMGMSGQDQCEVILGKRIGDPVAENRIDSAVKRYLTKAWNLRAGVTAKINAALGTNLP